MLTLETMASEEEYGPRNCVVCGDRATGYHFHALTCEGCKGFFRRTVSKTIGPICPFAGRCEVSKAQRRHCPACRLQKCLNVGMRKDSELVPTVPGVHWCFSAFVQVPTAGRVSCWKPIRFCLFSKLLISCFKKHLFLMCVFTCIYV